jgi:hypothetical protein
MKSECLAKVSLKVSASCIWLMRGFLRENIKLNSWKTNSVLLPVFHSSSRETKTFVWCKLQGAATRHTNGRNQLEDTERVKNTISFNIMHSSSQEYYCYYYHLHLVFISPLLFCTSTFVPVTLLKRALNLMTRLLHSFVRATWSFSLFSMRFSVVQI